MKEISAIDCLHVFFKKCIWLILRKTKTISVVSVAVKFSGSQLPGAKCLLLLFLKNVVWGEGVFFNSPKVSQILLIVTHFHSKPLYLLWQIKLNSVGEGMGHSSWLKQCCTFYSCWVNSLKSNYLPWLMIKHIQEFCTRNAFFFPLKCIAGRVIGFAGDFP